MSWPARERVSCARFAGFGTSEQAHVLRPQSRAVPVDALMMLSRVSPIRECEVRRERVNPHCSCLGKALGNPYKPYSP